MNMERWGVGDFWKLWGSFERCSFVIHVRSFCSLSLPRSVPAPIDLPEINPFATIRRFMVRIRGTWLAEPKALLRNVYDSFHALSDHVSKLLMFNKSRHCRFFDHCTAAEAVAGLDWQFEVVARRSGRGAFITNWIQPAFKRNRLMLQNRTLQYTINMIINKNCK